jgi:hypothetical protein
VSFVASIFGMGDAVLSDTIASAIMMLYVMGDDAVVTPGTVTAALSPEVVSAGGRLMFRTDPPLFPVIVMAKPTMFFAVALNASLPASAP